MVRLLKYSKKYKKEILLGPFFKLLEAIFELFLPLYMAKLIDQGIRQNDLTYIWQTAGKMFLMSCIGLACVMICQYYASIASQGFGTELRRVVFQKINQFPHAELDLFGTDTLVTRMTNDINQLQLALAMLIRLVIRAPFLSIGSVIMAFYIHPRIALIFAIVLPVFFFILVFLIKRTVPLFRRVQKNMDQLTRNIQENLVGIRVIRAFVRQRSQSKKISHTSESLAKNSLKAANISALLNPLTILIMNSATILLLYVSGDAVNIGSLNQGEVVALVNYLMQMLLALIIVSNLVVIFTRAATSASRINEILDTKETLTDSPETQIQLTDHAKKDKIIFENVSFKYPRQNGWTLENITFEWGMGKTLGIIGPTGSGKSSLIQLLPKFYDYAEGNIFLFGKNIGAYPVSELRNKIRLVPQKDTLISGTILSNLQWGKQDATEEEAWQALRIAQAEEFVRDLKEGLNSPVVEGGENFSGGQKQRLAIARAVINQPEILILDDSLSALDYRTDLALRKNLKTQLPNTTSLIVSQRISSIRQADHILVLDNGKIVGQGKHHELIQTNTAYQKIAASQENQSAEVK
ncbi:ABC transporter ATP-binding protein [Vagococcus elongatus]|uniref:ATP-binding protein n=1 Tax=Vagococcus elongatus TaxID=180344 RepID=A0A430APL1_9ENTE|nr:ABC transporter ATP-binding protein [Vagococcus elongatus]RSU09827.1 ATP-binding protein [Vagococcus elongatus]